MKKFYSRMMKALFLLTGIFSLSVFVSCSEKSVSSDSYDITGTLRYEADERFNSTKWTDEIEGDRLTSDISFFDTIESGVALSPAVLSASLYVKEQKGLFPYLEGFGFLDISDMRPDVKIVLDEFCAAVSKGNDADSFMESSSLYELAFFYMDLKSGWNEHFNADFPAREPPPSAAETLPETSSEITSGEETETAAEESDSSVSAQTEEKEFFIFSSFLYSTPFEMNGLYEVPVRFYAEPGYVDTVIFFSDRTEGWKIDQIRIKGWEAVK